MDGVELVVVKPRDPELKRLGWNFWSGSSYCNECDGFFSVQMCGTRAQAECWSPGVCPRCAEAQYGIGRWEIL